MSKGYLQAFLLSLASALFFTINAGVVMGETVNTAESSAETYVAPSYFDLTGAAPLERLAQLSDHIAARGAECPIGSGEYCSDTAPYCFLCRGAYACCWTSDVWKCCQ